MANIADLRKEPSLDNDLRDSRKVKSKTITNIKHFDMKMLPTKLKSILSSDKRAIERNISAGRAKYETKMLSPLASPGPIRSNFRDM